MTDRKRSSRTKPRKGKRAKGRIPRTPMLDQMCQRHTWDYGALSSGTTGIISFADMSPSISNFTEFSVLSSLFTEVKLLTAFAEFAPLDNISSSHAQGLLYVGTNMGFNKNATIVPTSVSQVENLNKMRTISTSIVRPVRVNMKVPAGLDFALIGSDAPATETPWAGSPGCLVGISGSGTLANSVRYFYVRFTAIHWFRGRV
jgi:hypothetical protein